MSAPNLAVAFNLPPERAVEYFQSRGMRVAGDWQSVALVVRSGAFSVAGVLKAQVLEDIRAALQDAIENGTTYEDFQRNLVPKLQAAGWWGRWPTDPETGEILPGKGQSPRRLETVFRTNTQSAYMSGRYKGMVESADTHPYWQYVAILDSRTRPRHRALHGRVFRWDDPIWQVIYPPNGYNCRCRVRPLTQAQLELEGLSVSEGAALLETITVDLGPRGGKVDVTGLRDPNTGEFFAPDVGFDHNPADAWRLDMELARRVAAIKSREIRAQTWQAMNNSTDRAAAWRDMVDTVLATRDQEVRRAGYDAFVLGFVDEDAAAFAQAQAPELDPTRVVVMNQRGLLHADAQKHQDAGIALTRDQYAMLPGIVAQPDEIYWDKEHGNLAYVRRLADGSAIYVPVTPDYTLRQVGFVDVAVNAYVMPTGNDGAGRLNNQGRYVRMGEVLGGTP